MVGELIQKLEEETGLDDSIVCSRNPLNRKLFPLRLQLPPNNATMHVVVIEGDGDVGLGGEVVDLVGEDGVEPAAERGRRSGAS